MLIRSQHCGRNDSDLHEWRRRPLRYAAKAAPVLPPLVGLAVGHKAAVGLQSAAGGAGLIVDWMLPKPQVPDRLRQAAVLYDDRRFFGKR